MPIPSSLCGSGFSANSKFVMRTIGTSPVPTGKQRALLAVLALHVGRVVPAEQIVDALWGEDPPPRCATVCRGSRRSCAARWARPTSSRCAAAATRSSCPPKPSTCTGTSSSSRPGRAAAADGDPSRAVALLAEADSLWRGDALADFTYEEFAAAAITRLSELRLAVIEERLDLELALGRHQASDRPTRGARRRASAARAAPRAADARAVPSRPAGRRAARLPGRSPHPRRGARARTEPRAPAVGVGDPRPGPVARRAGVAGADATTGAERRGRRSPKR